MPAPVTSSPPRPIAELPSGSVQTIASLDGIRAIAILVVFLAHSGLERFIPGGLGVTIFFVLSGYLITTLLRKEALEAQRIDYRAFYLRRIVRLMPPLIIVVALSAVLSAWDIVGGEFTLGGLLSALFYFGNYYDISHDFHGIPGGLGVLWSLAIEEHYYLLYPPLAALLLAIARPGRSALVLTALCALILVWRCCLTQLGASEAYLSMATDTRADAILAGCIMGFWNNPRLDPVAPANHRRDAGIAIGCLLVLIATLMFRNEFFRTTFRYTLQAFAIAPLVYLAVTRAAFAPYRWLNSGILVYLGKISYTIYLVHHLILLAITRQWPDVHWVWLVTAGGFLTLVAGELMRRLIDIPCAKLRRRLHKRWLEPRPYGALRGAIP